MPRKTTTRQPRITVADFDRAMEVIDRLLPLHLERRLWIDGAKALELAFSIVNRYLEKC